MPAHSQQFPWPPYYGHFLFFEQRMGQHSSVTNIKACGAGVYELTNAFGNLIRVFICECYSFGAAEYIETIKKVGNLDAIVINSAWCGYTMDAKRMARADKVGLFKIGDFMSALNRANTWEFPNKTETEFFTQKGWL